MGIFYWDITGDVSPKTWSGFLQTIEDLPQLMAMLVQHRWWFCSGFRGIQISDEPDADGFLRIGSGATIFLSTFHCVKASNPYFFRGHSCNFVYLKPYHAIPSFLCGCLQSIFFARWNGLALASWRQTCAEGCLVRHLVDQWILTGERLAMMGCSDCSRSQGIKTWDDLPGEWWWTSAVLGLQAFRPQSRGSSTLFCWIRS